MMFDKKWPAAFLGVFMALASVAQRPDSLYRRLGQCTADTCRVIVYSGLGAAYQGIQVDSVYKYAKLAYDLSNRCNFIKGQLVSLSMLGQYYWSTGDPQRSLSLMKERLAILGKHANKKEYAVTLGNIALLHNGLGEIDKAIDYYLQAIRIAEELGDKEEKARQLSNMGAAYLYKGDTDKAISVFLEAHSVAKECGSDQALITSLSNLGSAYYERKEYAKSLDHYLQSLDLIGKYSNRVLAGSVYTNIGNIYMWKGTEVLTRGDKSEANRQFSKAMQFFTQAIKIAQQTGDRNLLASSYGYMGDLYFCLKLFPQAEESHLRALAEADSSEDMLLKRTQYYSLSSLYEAMGRYDKALKFYQQYIAVRDSIVNEENTKRTVRLEMNYEFEKKESAARLQREKKEAVAKAESKRQGIIIRSVCGVLLLVIAFAVFAYRSFLQKKKANVEITRQKEIIEEKQKEIIDSIRYAQKIQRALITSEKYIDKELAKADGNTAKSI